MTSGCETHRHFVQFYKADEPLLNRNVGRFLWDGRLSGSALLVIAAPARRQSLTNYLERLGADVDHLIAQRQLAMYDAQEMLDRFMTGGHPNWEQFEEAIQTALAGLQPSDSAAGVAAYGEMVGILWEEGAFAAAILLEDYWNRLLHRAGIHLYCGYPIDVFTSDFHSEHLDALRAAHTHLVCGGGVHMETALASALDTVLGAEAPSVRERMKVGGEDSRLPESERAILWIWENLPQAADGILSCARQQYQTQSADGHAA